MRRRLLSAAAYGTLALADTVLAGGPDHWRARRIATKPLLMPVLGARLAGAPPGPGLRRLAAAQGLSWGGDLALMRPGRGSFLAGLTSFLLAHASYVAAYRTRSSTPVLGTSVGRRVLAAGTVSAVGMALAAGRQDRGLVVPVAVYGTTLATMVAAAAAIDPDRRRSRVLVGASLFLVSDTLLGVRSFVLTSDAPALEAAVMATYTAAQWCITDGLTS